MALGISETNSPDIVSQTHFILLWLKIPITIISLEEFIRRIEYHGKDFYGDVFLKLL